MSPSKDLISSLHRDNRNCTNTISIKISCLVLQTRKQKLEYRINEIMKITLAVFKFNLKCHFHTENEMTTSAFALELWVWCIMPNLFPVRQNQMAAPLYRGRLKPSENKETKAFYTSPDGLWALHPHIPKLQNRNVFLMPHVMMKDLTCWRLELSSLLQDLILLLSAVPTITQDTFPFNFQKSEQNGKTSKIVYQTHYNWVKK